MPDFPDRDRLVDLRRTFHRYPEPAWCEYWTTDRIVEECLAIGVDDLAFGPDVLAAEHRDAVPESETLEAWMERARDRGADPDRLDRMTGGFTGVVAVLDGDRDGRTVALRVDIDALPQREADDPDHAPVAAGFRSENDGYMHACGHDAHATIGLGVLDALSDRDFPGRVKVLFQPAEEVIGGARPMVESGQVDDVDALLAAHVGLGYDTGEIVAGMEGFLAVSQFQANFFGAPAHAGARPNEGRNAVQAMAAAVQGLQGIPRHEDGATRVNAGRVEGGTATNIVPESATIEGEVRGETTALMEYMRTHSDRVLQAGADMHDCTVEIERTGEAPTYEADPSAVDAVTAAAENTSGVTIVHETGDLGGSEDAALLLRRVQERGGHAAFVCIGTDHPGGHHTGRFDVDEDSLPIGVGVFAGALERLAAR